MRLAQADRKERYAFEIGQTFRSEQGSKDVQYDWFWSFERKLPKLARQGVPNMSTFEWTGHLKIEPFRFGKAGEQGREGVQMPVNGSGDILSAIPVGSVYLDKQIFQTTKQFEKPEISKVYSGFSADPQMYLEDRQLR